MLSESTTARKLDFEKCVAQYRTGVAYLVFQDFRFLPVDNVFVNPLNLRLISVPRTRIFSGGAQTGHHAGLTRGWCLR